MKGYTIIELNNKNLNRNYGLQILRMILSFWIVICHSCKTGNHFWRKIKNLKYHVPTFFIISFYYFYKNLYERNITKIRLRLERLLIPYFIWPIIVLFIMHLWLFIELKMALKQFFFLIYFLLIC